MSIDDWFAKLGSSVCCGNSYEERMRTLGMLVWTGAYVDPVYSDEIHYRDYHIERDPGRWTYVHCDYDGAEDSGDIRSGASVYLLDVLEAIDELEDDE